ncbi:hypothetical protein DFH05DRAFT_453458 [Lentinula detonsa]|uniref:Uncharacterized protein n=1 Tax=Lentinula detonsa TaxID=2804962 RepID=A0A9W8NSN7_9AGAR|nr:hypothetical protein DFH05DRAFT_453458 [Lentinula detonsa]
MTVRLTIKLGGPDNYTVDITSLAKASGQRPPTPIQKRQDESSDSEAEKTKAAEANQSDSGKPKKKGVNITASQIPSLMTLSLLSESSLPKPNNRVSMFPQEKLL